jgi:hypothetical protein
MLRMLISIVCGLPILSKSRWLLGSRWPSCRALAAWTSFEARDIPGYDTGFLQCIHLFYARQDHSDLACPSFNDPLSKPIPVKDSFTIGESAYCCDEQLKPKAIASWVFLDSYFIGYFLPFNHPYFNAGRTNKGCLDVAFWIFYQPDSITCGKFRKTTQ